MRASCPSHLIRHFIALSVFPEAYSYLK